jgi:ankyrin repeat protein
MSSTRTVHVGLLAMQSLALSIHFLVFTYDCSVLKAELLAKYLNIEKAIKSKWTRRTAIIIVPVAWIAMLIVNFVTLNSTPHQQPKCGTIFVDPDLAGIGVRTSLYGFGVLVGLTAILGHFHTEPSPISELSLLLWVSLTATLFNLFKGFIMDISDPHRVLVAMILDGYVNCLSIGLSMKETLAYRWKTYLSLGMQALGISGIVAALASLKNSSLVSSEGEQCRCVDVHWWGLSNTCGHMSTTLWFYLSLQTSGWLHTAWYAVRHSPDYQRARQVPVRTQTPNATIRGAIAESVYESIPATASSAYIAPIIGLLSSCVSLEMFLQGLDHQDLELWRTWGQSAQIVATVWAGFKVIHEIFRMFGSKSVERRRASLKRCTTGTNLPIVGCTDVWAPDGPIHRWLLFIVRRFFLNHPFGSLPPRRNSDHARFCSFDDAWKELRLDYRQWPNASDEEKGKLLHEGCKQGDEILVSNLIEEGAPLNHCDGDGKTPLRVAVDHDHGHIVSLLLAQRADCNIPDSEGTTPLHVCCETGRVNLIHMLLPSGASVHLTDTINTWTPLHVACRFGQLEITTLLLKNRANANAKDKKQRTPMHVAIRNGNENTVHVLAQNADVNSRDKKGKTPLYIAARYGRDVSTKVLLKHRANADIADSVRHFTPLHLCARYGGSRGDIAKLLLDYGCSTTLVSKEEQRTALHLAVNYGREKVVDPLLDANCNLDVVDDKDRTALYFAAKDDRVCTRKLLKKGADTAKGDISMLRDLLVKYGKTNEEAEKMIRSKQNTEILATFSQNRP